jgi:hypothetical protein
MKTAFMDKILFHKKDEINEMIVELDVNSLDATATTTRRTPKGKQT